MEGYRGWILPFLAFVLIAGAGATVLWLSHAHIGDPFPLGQRPLSQPEHNSAHSTLYRFLFPSEKQAAPGKLTLGRFADSRLCKGATWEFDSIDQWYSQAPSLFAKDTQWVAEEQPGWQISQWLSEDKGSTYGCNHLFWSIQALRCLDPGSFVNEIDMIERSGRMVTIHLTEGPGSYDYDTDTLHWNPISAGAPGGRGSDRSAQQADPLVALARELNHAWHDLCRNGDEVGVDEREQLAVMAENRMRHILFLKDPTRSHICPRSKASVSEDSSQQTWRDYRDTMNR